MPQTGAVAILSLWVATSFKTKTRVRVRGRVRVRIKVAESAYFVSLKWSINPLVLVC